MPIPKPKKGERKDKFMGRCMGMLTSENEHKMDNDKRPREQMVAICFAQWEQHHGEAELEEEREETDGTTEKNS